MQDPRKVGATVILTADESTYSGAYISFPTCERELNTNAPQTLASGSTTTGTRIQPVSLPSTKRKSENAE